MPTKSYIFTVRGKWIFPVDMLRYDQCWPKTTEDAVDMNHKDCGFVELRDIQMVSHSEPTRDRWLSFGWDVITLERS
jgi:hypothetical protein